MALPALQAGAGLNTPAPTSATNLARIEQVRLERQPHADRGDGTFRNPILAGHYHDPTIVRVGADYYMTHCPDLVMWHSRDLVNWRPIGRVDHGLAGDIWAPELIHHEGTFYLYLPVRLSSGTEQLRFTNVVLTATDPAGPWSKPIDLNLGGIDPGHVADTDGTRWLYVNEGRIVPLSPDGLRTVGEQTQVYSGWPIPTDWTVECFCLESPKLFRRGEWIYMVSAQGGTVGPSTSHMVTVARSRGAIGPWEEHPRNPILRTADRSEPWWSQGHGTIVDAPDGSWWMVYHAMAHGARSLGRNTLLLPITWTADGWPEVPAGVRADSVLQKPAGENVGHGLPLSDTFEARQLGIQWSGARARATCGAGLLTLAAQGDSPNDAARVSLWPVNRSYEVTVEVELNGASEAGLLITGTESARPHTGVALRPGTITSYIRHRGERTPTAYSGTRVWMRLRNIDHDVALLWSADGENWNKFAWGSEVSGNGTLRIALYASGTGGSAAFRHFNYRGLD